jgi:hypothetical protein
MKDLLEQLKEASGTEFENRFAEIMKIIYKERFQKTQVYKGDMKADGILIDNKTIFAVHAPETFKEANVLKKLDDDYKGFIEEKKQGNWKAIKKWIFVVKSDRKGITSKILDYISNVDGEHKVHTGIWGMEDIQRYALEWAPPELPGEAFDNLKSFAHSLQQGSEILIKDYEENGDRIYNNVEWILESQDGRERACKHISSLIDEINGIYLKYPGALDDLGLDEPIKKLRKLQPESISIVTLTEAYASLCKKTRNNEHYVLRKQCNKILKRLKAAS